MSRNEGLSNRFNDNAIVKYLTPQTTVEYHVTKQEAIELRDKDQKWLQEQKADANDETNSNRSASSMRTVVEGNDQGQSDTSSDDDYFPSIELNTPRKLSATVTHLQATLDRGFGHIIVNGSLPETAMAVFGAVGLQSVVDWMLNAFRFLGVHEKALFPAFNFALSLAVTGLEYLIRSIAGLNADSFKLDKDNQCHIGYYSRKAALAVNLDKVPYSNLPFSLDKLDLMVHTPFPKIKPFTRREAFVFTFLIYGMQITNGLFSEDPEYQKNNNFAAGLDKFYQNAFFVFYAQTVLTYIADKLLFNAIPATAVGIGEGLSKLGLGVASCAGFAYSKVTKCCEKDDDKAIVDATESFGYGS